MSTKLYVGNLSFDVTENDLRDMLSPHGPVNEINVIMDKITARPRGFAFATMNTQEGANAAILFGKQKANVSHHQTSLYVHDAGGGPGAQPLSPARP